LCVNLGIAQDMLHIVVYLFNLAYLGPCSSVKR